MSSPRYAVDDTGAVVTVELSRAGRWFGALATFAGALAVSLALMVVFFGIDFVLDHEARSAQGYSFFFARFVVGAALLVATIAAVMRGLARTRWRFDGRLQRVSVWMRTTMGHEFEDVMDEGALDGLLVRERTHLLGAHRLVLAMSGGDEIVVAQSRGRLAEIEEIAERIRAVMHLG